MQALILEEIKRLENLVNLKQFRNKNIKFNVMEEQELANIEQLLVRLKNLKVNDELFSSEYGYVNIERITDSGGHTLNSSNEATDLSEVVVTVTLTCEQSDFNCERYSVSGHSLKRKTSLRTLFKNKNEMLTYFINKV